MGDEGGFAPDLPSNESALEIILQSIERAGFRAWDETSCWVSTRRARSSTANGPTSSNRKGKVVSIFGAVCRLPRRLGAPGIQIASIEDGMAEDDWDGWKLLTEKLGDRVQLVGDDLS